MGIDYMLMAMLMASGGESSAYYYNEGDECVSLTGGWVEGRGNNQGTVSKEEDHLYLRAGTQEYSLRRFETAHAVNLSRFNTIETFANVGLQHSASRFSVSIVDPEDKSVINSVYVNTSGDHTLILDVSEYTGFYIIQVGVSTGTSASVTIYARVYKVQAKR